MEMMDLEQTITSMGLILFSTAVGFGTAWYWQHLARRVKRSDDASAERQALMDRIVELEKQSALIAQQVLPLNVAFQAMLVKELTHFHTPTVDTLLEKLGPPNTLTEDEGFELIHQLRIRANDYTDEIPQREREAAIILPYVIRRVATDIASLNRVPFIAVPAEHVDFVAVPAVILKNL